jgi:hypothetical protein
LDAGYAAAIGATGEPQSVIGPFPDTLLAGLRTGWTLGESYYLSNATDNWMWTLFGDPFLRVPDWSDVDGDGVGDAADACPLTPAGYVVDATGCFFASDFDNDGDVDASDFAEFAHCFNGAGRPPRTLACSPTKSDLADADGDGDVDGLDFGVFASCFNGAGSAARTFGCPQR